MHIVRLLKFGLVGFTGIIIDFSITWFLKEKIRWNKYLASSVGFCFAVINNYLLNRYFTFENTNAAISTQFLKFLIVSLTGLALSNLLLFMIQKFIHINFYFIKAIVIVIVFFWNYWVNVYYTFN